MNSRHSLYSPKLLLGSALSLVLAGLTPAVVHAQDMIVSGRVTLTEGHENPLCRRVKLVKQDGSALWFRIPSGVDNGILAVTITALTTGKRVDIGYVPTLTTGCGTEPRINYISIVSE